MHVLYIGPFAQRTEDGEKAHEIMLALHRAGISLEIDPIADCNTDDLDEEYRVLLPLVRPNQSKQVTHIIIHAEPLRAERILHEEKARAMVEVLADDYARAEQALNENEMKYRDARAFTSAILIVSKTTQEEEFLAALRTPYEAAAEFRFIVIPKILDEEKERTFVGSFDDIRRIVGRVRRIFWPSDIYYLLKE